MEWRSPKFLTKKIHSQTNTLWISVARGESSFNIWKSYSLNFEGLRDCFKISERRQAKGRPHLDTKTIFLTRINFLTSGRSIYLVHSQLLWLEDSKGISPLKRFFVAKTLKSHNSNRKASHSQIRSCPFPALQEKNRQHTAKALCSNQVQYSSCFLISLPRP